MTATEIKNRVQELRAQGKTRQQAHEQAHREGMAAQDAAWRAQDPERQ
jgi:hypothetical protein